MIRTAGREALLPGTSSTVASGDPGHRDVDGDVVGIAHVSGCLVSEPLKSFS